MLLAVQHKVMPHLLRTLATKVSLGLCVISLSVLTLCAMAYLDWNLLQESHIASIEAPVSYSPEATPEEPSSSIQIINQAKLFGDIESLDTITPAIETPLTTLDFSLKGTFTQIQDHRSYALIEQSGKTSTFYPGDELAQGVKVIAIHPGHVMIRRDDMDERLSVEILKKSNAIAFSQTKPGENSVQENHASTSEAISNPSIESLPGDNMQLADNTDSAKTEQTLTERLDALRESINH